jgi:hypothetical protein
MVATSAARPRKGVGWIGMASLLASPPSSTAAGGDASDGSAALIAAITVAVAESGSTPTSHLTRERSRASPLA